MFNIVTIYNIDLLNQYSLWFVNQTKNLVATTILLKRIREWTLYGLHLYNNALMLLMIYINNT